MFPSLTAWRRPRHRHQPADGAMPLMDHLNEFRRRLFVAALGIGLGTGIGFVWFGHGIPAVGLPSLGTILTGPYCAVPAGERLGFGTGVGGAVGVGGDECRLLATGPFSALELQLKSALIAGTVLSAPVWLSQLWGFVTPALHTSERRYAITFSTAGAVLFAAGAALAYLVIREGLTVLLAFGGDTTIAALTPDSYFAFLIAMLIIFGVSFELPLLLIMLNRTSVVSHTQLSGWRRYAVFGLVVFAGLVVPGNDPITMLALAVALTVLYELSVQIARVHDRRLARREPTRALSDDEPSALPDPDSEEVAR